MKPFYIAACLTFLVSVWASAQSSLLDAIQKSAHDHNYELALRFTDSFMLAQKREGLQIPLPFYANRATFVYLTGRHIEAMQLFQNCLTLAELRRDTEAVAAISANMGNLLYHSGKPDDAAALYLRALAQYRLLQDTFNQGISYYQVAQCYLNGRIFDADAEAYVYEQKLKELKDPGLQVVKALLRAQIMLRSGDFSGACDKLWQLWQQCETGEHRRWQGHVALSLSELYAEMEKKRALGKLVPFNFCVKDEPLGHILQRARALAQQNANLKQQTVVQFALARYFQQLKDFPNAFNGLNDYTVLQEKLIAFNNSQEITRIEAAYRNRDQKRQIDLLTAQNEKDKIQNALALQQRENDLLQARTEAERRENLLRIMEAQRELDTCATQSARIELNNAAMENIRKNEAILALQQVNALQKIENQRNKLALALLAALGLLGAGAVWIRYKRAHDRRLSALRNRLSRDLHDDLGSTLSSIALNSRIAGDLESPEKMRETLARISEEAREASANVKDLVWAMHPDADSMAEMLARMRQFAQNTLEPQGIEHQFDVGEGVEHLQLDMETRRHLYLLFKEAINNAAKYAEAAHVHIRLEKGHKTLHLEIADNGKGFDPQTPRKGNGLVNMEARAALLGGKLRVESGVGRGTRVVLGI